MSILLAIPIGIVYNLAINKASEIFNEGVIHKDKIQNNLIIEIISGIGIIILAMILFGEKSKMKNKIVKYGLYFGGGLLLFHALFCNWDTLENSTKLFMMFGILITMIMYAYQLIK